MDTANATTTPAWYSWVPLLGIQYSPCRSLWWTWRTCAKGESSHIAKRCFWNTIDAKRGFLALKWKSCTSSNTNRAFFAKKIRNDFTTYILQSYKVSSNHQTKIPLAHLAFFKKNMSVHHPLHLPDWHRLREVKGLVRDVGAVQPVQDGQGAARHHGPGHGGEVVRGVGGDLQGEVLSYPDYKPCK